MKKLISVIIMILLATSAMALSPKAGEISAPSGSNWLWDGSFWRAMTGSSSGILEVLDSSVVAAVASVSAAVASVSANTSSTIQYTSGANKIPVTTALPLPTKTTGFPKGYAVYIVPAVGSIAVTIPTGTDYVDMCATVPFLLSIDTATAITGTCPIIGINGKEVGATTTLQLTGYNGATSSVTVYSTGH